MVSMLVLAFASLGLVKITYQMRVTAEDVLHQSTATVMAQGYLEQLFKLPYNSPSGIYDQYGNAPGLVQIADSGVPVWLFDHNGNALSSLTNGQTMIFGSILNSDGTTSTQGNNPVYLDIDVYGKPSYPMNFSFTPVVYDLWVATGGTWTTTGGTTSHTATGGQGTADGMLVVVYFTEQYSIGGITRSYSSSVRTVCSNVPTQ